MNYPALLQLLSQVIGAVENIAGMHPSGLPAVMSSMRTAKTQLNAMQEEHAATEAPPPAAQSTKWTRPGADPAVAKPDAPPVAWRFKPVEKPAA